METVQIVMNAALLRATDQAAKRVRVNRSALVREALREYLKRLETQELEACDRLGYERYPQDPTEAASWEEAAAWPQP